MSDDIAEGRTGTPPPAAAGTHSRARGMVFACTTVPLLVLYAASAGTWPRPDDAGELMTAAARLGIAHPSGYPLLTLLGKAATHLPIGTVAYRLNLLVALMGATACGLLAVLVMRSARNVAAAVLTGLALGLTPVIWRNSTNFEVYTLNALLIVAALLCATLAWHPDTEQNRRGRWLWMLGLSAGLGVSHHLSFVAVLPALVPIAWNGRACWTPSRRQMTAAVMAFALGLTPWLYLPIRAWYFPHNAQTCWTPLPSLGAVIGHMTALEYRSKLLAYAPAGIPILLRRFADTLWQQFGPLLALVPFGLVSTPRAARGLLHAAAVLLGVNVVLFLGYVVDDYQVFYIPSFIAVALYTGLGIRRIAEWVPVRAASVALAVGIGAVTLALGATRWPAIAQHGAPFTSDYVTRLERMLPADAVVIVAAQWSDPDGINFPVLYAREVEGRMRGIMWESGRRMPNELSAQSMGRPIADAMARELLTEIGMSETASEAVLDQPPARRMAALVALYDGLRPLYTDSPALFLQAGFGAAYNGYFFRRLPEPGYRLDADPQEMLEWASRQATRPEADQALQDNLSLPLINHMYYIAQEGNPRAAATATEVTARALPKSPLALHLSLQNARAGGNSSLAWQVLRRIKTGFPYHAGSYVAEAELLLSEGRYPEALRAVDRGMALTVERRDQTIITRALCYLGMGDSEKAREVAGPHLWPQALAAARTPGVMPTKAPAPAP